MGAPSGQHHQFNGNSEAQITRVRRHFAQLYERRPALIDGFGIDERATDGRGKSLSPLPNQITDGRYRYGDHECEGWRLTMSVGGREAMRILKRRRSDAVVQALVHD